MYSFSLVLTLIFNFIIFLDLYLILKKPFYPRQWRAKYYILFVVIFSVLYWYTFIYIADPTPENKIEIAPYMDEVYLISLGIIGFMSYILVFLVIRVLQRKGTSKILRQKVCRRHLVYSAMYVGLLLEFFVYFMYRATETDFDFNLRQILMIPLGIVLGYIRLIEPFVWQNFKKNILKIKSDEK